jgi:CRP-like cAMP-binding protein
MPNALISYLQLFKDISYADAAFIQSRLQCRSVAEGECLLQEGRVPKELFFVCSGILKIVKVNEKGKDITHFFVKENHFCTILHSFLNEQPSGESIEAACAAELVVLTKKGLDEIYAQLSWFKELHSTIMQQSLLKKIQLRNELQGEDASTRYQKFLVLQPDIALRVSLSDIASHLGITLQSLSRIRRNTK